MSTSAYKEFQRREDPDPFDFQERDASIVTHLPRKFDKTKNLLLEDKRSEIFLKVECILKKYQVDVTDFNFKNSLNTFISEVF